MSDFFHEIAAAATFSHDGATKADLCRGAHLFVGLNCFERGQSQRTHTHAVGPPVADPAATDSASSLSVAGAAPSVAPSAPARLWRDS